MTPRRSAWPFARVLCPAAALAAALFPVTATAADTPAHERTLPRATQKYLPEDWRWLSENSFAGIELWQWLGFALSIVIGLAAGRVLRAVLMSTARRLESRQRRLAAVALRALARAAVFGLAVLGLQAGFQFLPLTDAAEQVADSFVRVLIILAVGYAAYCLIGVVDEWHRQISASGTNRLNDMLALLLTRSLRVTVIVLVLVQIATVLSDKPATSIIAGLGVGGLAIGLAAQDTIKNFFGSMMLCSDRPFEMGDTITVDGRDGTVEAVGFRSTRLRTPDGFLMTIPNGDLANKTIINVSKRPSLMRKLNLQLPVDLSSAQVTQALAIVREILHDHEGLTAAQPARVYFSEITPSALTLSINYWYAPADWWRFMAFNERVNLAVLERLAAAGIRLAAPPPAASGT